MFTEDKNHSAESVKVVHSAYTVDCNASVKIVVAVEFVFTEDKNHSAESVKVVHSAYTVDVRQYVGSVTVVAYAPMVGLKTCVLNVVAVAFVNMVLGNLYVYHARVVRSVSMDAVKMLALKTHVVGNLVV